MRAINYTAYDIFFRPMYTRAEAFDSIAQAIRHCCAFYTLRYKDLHSVAAASFVAVTTADGKIRRYQITGRHIARLRWARI